MEIIYTRDSLDGKITWCITTEEAYYKVYAKVADIYIKMDIAGTLQECIQYIDKKIA